jgi:hypothetical protein
VLVANLPLAVNLVATTTTKSRCKDAKLMKGDPSELKRRGKRRTSSGLKSLLDGVFLQNKSIKMKLSKSNRLDLVRETEEGLSATEVVQLENLCHQVEVLVAKERGGLVAPCPPDEQFSSLFAYAKPSG